MSMTANHRLFPCHTLATAIPRRGSWLHAVALAAVALAVVLVSAASSASAGDFSPLNSMDASFFAIDDWPGHSSETTIHSCTLGRGHRVQSDGSFTCYEAIDTWYGEVEEEWHGRFVASSAGTASGADFTVGFTRLDMFGNPYADYKADVYEWGIGQFLIVGSWTRKTFERWVYRFNYEIGQYEWVPFYSTEGPYYFYGVWINKLV